VLIALDGDLVATLDDHFDADLARSEQIDLSRWRDRFRPQRVLETATKPIRRWL
jgi:cardiolipin synthase A/B